jgi:hypothetical protein
VRKYAERLHADHLFCGELRLLSREPILIKILAFQKSPTPRRAQPVDFAVSKLPSLNFPKPLDFGKTSP